MLGAQFLFLIETADIQPVFSPDGTVLTVALPTPLPAGLPIYVRFDEFYDLAGNASTAPLEYRVDVSGNAEVWPWIDGQLGVWWAFNETVKGTDPPFTDEYFYMKRIEEQSDGTIEYSEYHESPPVDRDGWEIFGRDASSIDLLGFGEVEGDTPVEVRFADPVQWLALPATPGTRWGGSTTFPFGEVVADLDYSGEVLAVEDLLIDLELDGPPVVWLDCWKVQVDYEISDEGTPMLTGREFIWYAPTIGPVREMTHEEDAMEDRVSDDDEWLLGFEDYDL